MMMPPWLMALLVAPFVGSFLGVVIERLPHGRPLVVARSQCAACRRPLRPAELVPFVSFLLQRGRCRSCGARIGWFAPSVEGAALAIAASAALGGEDGLLLWEGCALGWTLLALAWIDWRHFVLPDALTLPLLVAGLGAAVAEGRAMALDSALGAALGYGGLWLVGTLYRRLRGREGLGGGDAKLLAAGGAWLGAAALPWVVLGAAVGGLAIAGLTRRGGLAATLAVPFGPPLAAAIWLVWLWPGLLPG